MSTLIAKLPQLRKAANEAMWGAWHDAGLDKGMPREVECIKELVGRALPRVQAQWVGILKPAGIMARLQRRSIRRGECLGQYITLDLPGSATILPQEGRK